MKKWGRKMKKKKKKKKGRGERSMKIPTIQHVFETLFQTVKMGERERERESQGKVVHN